MDYPESQFEYDQLVFKWHERRRFPRGWGGVAVAGICLVLLDADLAQLVGTYVERRKLRPGAIKVLRGLQDDLQRVLPELSGEAAEYFTVWNEFVSETLRLAEADG